VTQLNPGHIATEAYPKKRLMQSRFGRLLVGRPADVADAVVDVLIHRPRERTVPRWYRAVVVLRHVVPGLFWGSASRTRRARGIRD
jgi:short-subunit dehydrogenase